MGDFPWAIYSYFLAPILNIVIFTVFVGVILSWLVAFNVVNPRNQFVQMVMRFTQALTEPLLAPFRRVIPTLGGMDFTPVLLILTLVFTKDWLLPQVIAALAGPAPFGFR